MNQILALALALQVSLALNAQNNDGLRSLVHAFSKTSAITGREEEAAKFVTGMFPGGSVKTDKLGNLVVTIGTGRPKRLFTVPLDEPGYVVSSIMDNGYLRIAPVGYGHRGNMYHQFLQGSEITIGTENGAVPGVAVVPSSHYEGLRAVPEATKPVYQWQETFLDVGQPSAKAVGERGIRLLDPVTIAKKPVLIREKYIAAPSIPAKAAVIALTTVARTLMQEKLEGTVVVAFTTLELLNGKGIENVVRQYGPFDLVVRFNRFLSAEAADSIQILADKDLRFTSAKHSITKPLLAFRHPATGYPQWDTTNVFSIGLPSYYAHTPVEMIRTGAVSELAQSWLHAIEKKSWALVTPPMPVVKQEETIFKSFAKENDLLDALVGKYGVSGQEKPVRELILSRMPRWARPTIDEKGNIVLTFGKGKQHIGFVAHMDEVGYVVDSIRLDGTIVVRQRGGFFNSVWEGKPAVIHASGNGLPAVFEPRAGHLTATSRSNGSKAPTVFAGFLSRDEVLQAGIVEGVSTVTMPKKAIRLSEEKATARGFDDRTGCAALLQVLTTINPDALPFRVTFVWSVEEETGLTGATWVSGSLKDLAIVYPIDTYVSSDDPVDPRIFGYCPLGAGAVIRVLESINMVSREHLKYLQQLALKKKISIQYGMTAGGTDGQPFLKFGIPSVPLSWPGRYSHSPVEVMDFRDLKSLVSLITAIITDGSKVY